MKNQTETKIRTAACSLCGGTAGQTPDGRHNLCAARKAAGLPTPSLGDRCETCGGAGTLGRGGVMLGLDLGPAAIAKSIKAQFPPCPGCQGRGYTGGDPAAAVMSNQAYYTDPAGTSHTVNVIERGKKMTLIEYMDNARRGETWRRGRRYSHATRTRVWVYNHELRDLTPEQK